MNTTKAPGTWPPMRILTVFRHKESTRIEVVSTNGPSLPAEKRMRFIAEESAEAMVREARAEAFEEVCKQWDGTALSTAEFVVWIFEEKRKAKSKAARATDGKEGEVNG